MELSEGGFSGTPYQFIIQKVYKVVMTHLAFLVSGKEEVLHKENLGRQATRTGHLLLRDLSASLAASREDR